MTTSPAINVSIRPTTPADLEDPLLPVFDNTKLVAMNTCPVWGLVRYEYHKAMPSSHRPMALEAGGACHRSFAAIRYADLMLHGRDWFGADYDQDFVNEQGSKEFPGGLWDELLTDFNKDTDPHQRTMLMGISALFSSGYYDDPDDKRRTLANLEQCVIAYADLYKLDYRLPVYAPKQNLIGIELPIDTILEITDPIYGYCKLRFVGRADGLIYHSKSDRLRLRIAENKTGSRIDEAWESSMELSHQLTGYMVGLSSILRTQGVEFSGDFIKDASVYGLAIPLPKYTNEHNGVKHVPATRREDEVLEWAKWIAHTLALFNTHRANPLDAPKYTHSCNRYFRPCSFIPLCTAPPSERLEIWNELVENKWSPLDDVTEGASE